MDITYAYAGDIVKTHEEDGSLFVYGKATGPDLDLDEQICDESWLRSAMPEWMKFGNVREMHQPIAAGVGIELESKGDDWFLKSQVIDDNTARKIEAGALKGYSVGIKGAKVVHDDVAKGGRIVGGTIVEVSYVDRPCNPTAIANIAKSIGGQWNAVETLVLDVEPEVTKDDSALEVNAPWEPAKTHDIKDESKYPNDYACPVCNGLGKFADTGETCPNCEGKGRVDEAPVEAGISAAEMVTDQKDAESEVEKITESGSVADLYAEWKASDGSIEKVEHNAADLSSVRDSMIALIKAELDEIVAGEEDEVGDVRDLLTSLKIFLDWWTGEASEGETEAPFTSWDDEDKENEMAYVAMGVSPDTMKAAKTGDEEAISALRSEVSKVLDLEVTITEIVKAAQREEVDFLKAELERVKEMASPGGPALARTQAQSSKALDAERMKSEADRLRHVAEQVTDVELRRSYIDKAISLEKSATEILGA